MKRILLFAILIVIGATACKKSEKDGLDNFTLIGRWEISNPAPMMTPGMGADSYTFKTDLTYSRFMLGDIIEDGTYQIRLTNQPRVYELTLRRRGTEPGYVIGIEKIAENQIEVISHSTKATFTRKPLP